METTRRGFLQVAGLAAVGLVVAKPAIDLFSHLNTSGTQAEIADQIRLAMAIDINACNKYKEENGGCNLCEVACHTWHKVPDIPDHEEEIKWIWEDYSGKVFEEHQMKFIDYDKHEELETKLPLVKLLCNQCHNPPCIKYCPTRATWKRSDGIIMVDFHRCIGCRYCMAGCPYGARSFNWRKARSSISNPWRLPQPAGVDDQKLDSDFPSRTRGMVEKCNFCADILITKEDGLLDLDDNGNAKEDQIPKCVKACQADALIYGNLLNHESDVYKAITDAHVHVLRRLPELGTNPNNYYILKEA
ncbi:4Fe-4S dicluster domain-containing protein [Chloroflexota bacterium]